MYPVCHKGTQETAIKRIVELDGLRALAILLVLGCHFEGFSQRAAGVPEFGWIGVDIFFVLSGYLITTILLGLRGKATPYKTFYARRLVRILPPYLVIVGLVAATLAHQHRLSVPFIRDQVLFLQAFGPEQRKTFLGILAHFQLPPIMHNAHHLKTGLAGTDLNLTATPEILWSLSIEEYFYLLWAPIVLRCSRASVFWIGIAVCAGEVLLRWAANTPAAYFGLPFRFDALVYGAFLALLLDRWSYRGLPARADLWLRVAFLGSASGIATILFLVRPVLGREVRESPLVLALGLPMFSIACASIMGLLILRSTTVLSISWLLRRSIFQMVGTVSYTMYLAHLLAASVVRHLAHVANPFSQTLAQAVLSTLLTFALAQASWHFLESPLLRWKERQFPKGKVVGPYTNSKAPLNA